ncbi:hypothetical protein GCM10009527_053760 [Actinomadura nitritigenes]
MIGPVVAAASEAAVRMRRQESMEDVLTAGAGGPGPHRPDLETSVSCRQRAVLPGFQRLSLISMRTLRIV